MKEEKKPLMYYLWYSQFIIIPLLLLFLAGFIIYSRLFGIPCWAFDGASMNTTWAQEMILKCGN